MADEVNSLSDSDVEEMNLAADQWVCSTCTLSNPPTCLACGACDTLRNSTIPPPGQEGRDAIDQTFSPHWTCKACTYVNKRDSATCFMCSRKANGQEDEVVVIDDDFPPPSRPAGKVCPPSTAAEDDLVYTLDCSCTLQRYEAMECVSRGVEHLPKSLVDLVNHFRCPSEECQKPLTRRDLEALLGAKAAKQVDTDFWTACSSDTRENLHHEQQEEEEEEEAVIDLVSDEQPAPKGQPTLDASCMELYFVLRELHTALIDKGESASNTKLPSQKQNRPNGGYRGRGRRGGGAAGTGYGGGRHEEGINKQVAEQVQRKQDEHDETVTKLLHSVKGCLEAHSAKVVIGGSIPLPVQSVIRGGPLASCLRLMLCNDSLMDISTRQGMYTQVLQILQVLAASIDLLPVLLQPADSDVLASFTVKAEKSAGKRPAAAIAGATPPSAKRRKGSASGAGSSKIQQPAPAEPLQNAANDANNDESTSCWFALLQLRLQADVFRRNASALQHGEEEDALTVAMALDVLEACERVQQAVQLWQSSQATPMSQQQQQPVGQEAAAALEKKYCSEIKALSFRTLPLLQSGNYYFRSQVSAHGHGDVHKRLRRITKEISTLPGQLPVAYQSSILLAIDEDRIDVIRALIFAPPGTPYAHGTFLFDILLPASYPEQPPLVQFLTTGGGRVRFHPNL